jgi:tetratricopeptide (TPR) repeat protein
MTHSQTHYQRLGVAENADLDQIKRAYREQIRKYHPDKFAGERAQLERDGYTQALKALDRDIARAKQMTQRINQSYAVLSDATRRAQYNRELIAERDRQLDLQLQRQRHQRVQNMERTRRAVKSRPHNPRYRAAVSPSEQAIPWVLLGVFLLAVVFFAWQFGRLLWMPVTPRTYVPDRPTAVGAIAAADLQATEQSRQATREYRAERALMPTMTPRTDNDVLRSADVLLQGGNYRYAIELYDRVLSNQGARADVLTSRGIAYAGQYSAGRTPAYQQALDDFAQALTLDADFALAYRERGLLYHLRWTETGASDARTQAIADLEQYLDLIAIAEPAIVDVLALLREG